ncbi:DUF960 domain-containing protein [Streptococcus dysgalactiae]|uniref:DUF960 domain-containing protein n=1 Tax=Streptococcus dysgalactiae TaxID=1334 RepID=UPI0010CABDA2|nr:DUF960 domain-containing protein [Streptococcus dysgalactiae]VTT22089.1 Staphylococcal protein of uncharacterised function (DUF960) [Streptococcus dysgalactiae subsp. equisimilis]
MAFQKAKERYASFGVATSLPPELIDTFWEIIDHYLKGVFPLNNLLVFKLIKKSYEYIDRKRGLRIVFDYKARFDPFYPRTIYVVDNSGIETILLPHEIN